MTRKVVEEEVINDPKFYISNQYGFAVDWEMNYEYDVNLKEEEIYFTAVERLFNSINDYPNHSDKIEKFCLPLLKIIDSDIAVDRSIEGIITKPHMTRVYNSYLSSFTPKNDEIASKIENILGDHRIVSDYQTMYIFASLLNCKKPSNRTINLSIRFLQNSKYKKETRAIAALFAAKHGNPQQKRAVKSAYESEPSPYVRSAILYASKHFSNPEKRACLNAWGSHNMVNTLIANGLK